MGITGEVLGANNMAEDDWHSDDDDDKGSLGRDVVNTLHFGGGMIEKKGGANIYGPGGDGHDGGENKAPKNRLDALQEIVAKSKMFKLQKKEAKEEQENDREKLDKDFQALVSGSLLDFKPTRRDRSEDKDENDVMDEYDMSLRAMTYESKVRPSDRTKSDEEKAVEARTRLEELEAARLRRMNNALDPEDENNADMALKHRGEEGKKRKRVTDDEVDGSFGSSYPKDDEEDDEGGEDEEEEEGDDDEEEEEDDEEEDDEENDDEEGEDEDDWEDEDAQEGDIKVEKVVKSKKSKAKHDDEDESDGEKGDEDEEGDGDDDDEEVKEKEKVEDDEPQVSDRVVKKLKKADRAVEQLASDGTYASHMHASRTYASRTCASRTYASHSIRTLLIPLDPVACSLLHFPHVSQASRIREVHRTLFSYLLTTTLIPSSSLLTLFTPIPSPYTPHTHSLLTSPYPGVNDMMPHKVNCPSSAEEFDKMTSMYVRSAADLRELISRILVWSSVHLPGKEGSDNRGTVGVVYNRRC